MAGTPATPTSYARRSTDESVRTRLPDGARGPAAIASTADDCVAVLSRCPPRRAGVSAGDGALARVGFTPTGSLARQRVQQLLRFSAAVGERQQQTTMGQPEGPAHPRPLRAIPPTPR